VILNSAGEKYRQGLLHYGRHAYAQAIAAYESALVERPNWSECLQALGMAQMHAGHLDEALSNLKRVTELSPEDPLAFTSLSMCFQRLNRIADAEHAQAQARLLSWRRELQVKPRTPPP
jgi:Flp pilus assembly protein TadD